MQEQDSDALVQVILRDEFYRKKFHTVFGVHVLCWLTIVILFGMIYYLVQHPRSPYYFATDNAGRFIKTVPVQQPNMATDSVIQWASAAVVNTLSYDYMDYRSQLQNAQKYFTDYGWQAYMKGLTDSLNLVALRDRSQIVIAKLAGPGKVIAEGQVGKAAIYAWKIQFPVLMTYMTPPFDNVPNKTVFQNPLQVTVVVERQDELSSYMGLGIVQFIATVVES